MSAVLLPVLVFYAILFRHTINMPLIDDYDGVLGFLERYSRLSSFSEKLVYVLTTQHNEYKTIFANAVIALQYQLSGHPNFVALSWIGNLFVLPLGYFLWREFLPRDKDTARRLLLFVPVSCLLFQLQYGETLNWSSPGLENIPILFFTLAGISALTRQTSAGFLWASGFLVLAIASSGNGFALVPLGIWILLARRHRSRAVAWAGVGLACAAGYFYHYNFHSSQQSSNGSVLESIYHLNPLFMLSFAGSVAANTVPGIRFSTIVVGAAIAAVLLWMARSRFDRVNPAYFYFSVFLALTAIGVSGIRSKLGFHASVASRYRVYSDLLLICCYTFLVERYAARAFHSRRRWFLALVATSVFLCATFDWTGSRMFSRRETDMAQGAELYKRSHHQRGPIVLDGNEKDPNAVRINPLIRPIVKDAETTGLYRFP